MENKKVIQLATSVNKGVKPLTESEQIAQDLLLARSYVSNEESARNLKVKHIRGAINSFRNLSNCAIYSKDKVKAELVLACLKYVHEVYGMKCIRENTIQELVKTCYFMVDSGQIYELEQITKEAVWELATCDFCCLKEYNLYISPHSWDEYFYILENDMNVD